MKRFSLVFVALGCVAMMAGCSNSIAMKTDLLYPKGLEPREGIYGPGYSASSPVQSEARGFAPLGNAGENHN